METTMKQCGFKFYVYVMAGWIDYFYNYEAAAEYAAKHNAEVKEIDI